MAWGDGRTIIDRFEDTRHLTRAVLPRGIEPGSTYQGFCKAMLSPRGMDLLDRARVHLRGQIASRSGRWEKRLGFVAFGADGSRVACPRTIANETEFGLWGKGATHPQMNLTCLWHMGVGLTWDWRIAGSDTGERALLLEMLPSLPEKALIVADAGFTGFELLNAIQESGRYFLVRVGSNVDLLTDLGAYKREGTDTVYLWPEKHRAREPLVLRLILVGSVYLITNVLDRTRMSVPKAGMLYRLRWGIEVGFRTLKQTLDRRTMRCAAPAQAKMELNWSVLGLTLLGLMSVAQIKRRRKDPLDWSPAASLRIIRRARAAPGVSRRDAAAARDQLLKRLGRCTKDDYQRNHGKNSWNWPHKKNPAPAGAPTLQRASKALRTRASALNAAA